MGFGQDYSPEEYKNGTILFADGEYRIRIDAVEEKVSRNGNNMRVVELSVSGQAGATVKYNLVEGEYFNSNMTKFFDCFGIQLGNFNIAAWLKKTGRAYIHQEEYEYEDNQGNKKKAKAMKIKFLIVDRAPDHSKPMGQRSQAQPTYNRPAPQQQAAPQQAADEFEDDIPF